MLRGKVTAGNINLGVICISAFKDVDMNDVMKEVGIEREEKKKGKAKTFPKNKGMGKPIHRSFKQ